MTKKQKTNLIRIIVSAVLVIGVWASPLTGWLEGVLYLIPYFIVGYDILLKAVKGIFRGQMFDENFLMAVATVGAMALGDWREGCAVMVFYQIGELFQSYAVGKSRRSISDLMDIRPDYANIESGGALEKVDPEDVAVGTVIVVQPGERIPIDGVVTEGEAAVNTSALTGESLPRQVKAGDEVLSGCVNLSGLLHIRTTKEFGDSTVAKILDLVENSSMKKAKAENFITKFARIYTPAVCYSAVALAVLPPVVRLIMGNAPMWGDWITRALTFLVISCPCALVISIPLSFFGGIGGASAKGILVKGSNYLEALAKTGCVVFDKTGTLTKGVFQVLETAPEGMDAQTLLGWAAQAECYSKHPISQSLKSAWGGQVDTDRVTDVEELGGFGLTGRVDGHAVAVGNRRLMEKLGIQPIEPQRAGTVVYVAVDGVYAGWILLGDVVKEHAAQAIRGLKAEGVEKTVMLTGDADAAARQVAFQLGVDEVHSQLLPADKVRQVERLLKERREGRLLAFVGDGINDAPVLARADIGIAMGALGSDAAIEAADVVLMDDDPAKIALAMRISRRTLRIVYENIVFALAVKAVCLVLGAIGIANMWLAIGADVGVMVLAVLNATRALSAGKE
ncbi:MAG: cadmium-translocating P-type ATPase [Oscillospiraceae bacterium]|nr:cadmium-translocating P-type ATPase [Oscillospiraceae bacterium]